MNITTKAGLLIIRHIAKIGYKYIDGVLVTTKYEHDVYGNKVTSSTAGDGSSYQKQGMVGLSTIHRHQLPSYKIRY